MEIAVILLLAFFAVMAVIEIISAKNYRKDCQRRIILIPVTDKMYDIEHILRQTLEMIKLSEEDSRIIICNMGADNEITDICRRFSEEYPIFELIEAGAC
ncbi:MAG: hypothetical protein NC120_03640 [Ruminococcus sp.]|nr:hypothetical protein [Ruminococcus sp.]